MPARLRSRRLRYGLAGLATALAVAIPEVPGLGAASRPLASVNAVLAAAWLGGPGPGLAATAAIAACQAAREAAGSPLEVSLFLAGGAIISLQMGLMHAARRRDAAEVARSREEELRYRLLFEGNPDPMWVYDVETLAFLEVNRAAQASYGYDRDEFLALTIVDIRPAGDRTAVRRVAAELGPTPFHNAGTWRHRRKDGTELDVEISSSPLSHRGRPARLVLAHDVSGHALARSELSEAVESALAAGRAKDEFLAMLSHELRTPLTPVLLAASELLEDPSGLAAEVRLALEMTLRNVEIEARLIDDLLDVTRIARGKLPMSRRPVGVHDLILRAAEICAEPVRAGGVRLSLDLAAARDWVEADPARLQQAFWNLIKNAAKFTPRGGSIAVRSRVAAGAGGGAGGDLVVEVVDDGRGIDPGFLPRMFEPFTQADDGRDAPRGGLGLGLAITRSVVEAHGGRISAASAGPGLGSTFTITLPLSPAAPDAGRGPAAASPARVGPPARRSRPGLSILVVEDHADTAAVIASVLRRAGHRASTADSLRAARASAGESAYDLVICDIGLPDGSGLDLIADLGRPGVPAIALSGYGMEADVRRSRDAGFSAHLIKPIDSRELEAAIAALIPA